MNRLVIVGAGGHGKVLADCALKNGYTEICFVDDNARGSCMGFPILGDCSLLSQLDDGSTDFVIAIGSNRIRQRVAQRSFVHWTTLIHPSAQIGAHVTIGPGSVVLAGAVVNACASIGSHCIINSRAVVEHDDVIDDFVHISPGANIGGTVCIGALTHVGIGAAVRNNVCICGGTVIGAGAVVVKNLDEPGTYVGIPAKKMK